MTKICPICGIDYKHIVSKRRLGCSFCYFTFKTEMYYVFKEKQDGACTHLGKVPKNFTNPVNMFVNREIEKKISDEELKHELKKAIKLNYYHGEKK